MDDARQDVERAERVWVNSEVAKLAGILAYKRGDLEMAQQKFETAAALNPDDCEIAFDRAAVFADRRDWQHAVDRFVAASACLDRERNALQQEIARVERSSNHDARQARIVDRRERQITAGRRLQAQAWFNIAAACINLSRRDEARRYAELLAGDDEFGERARALLARLR